MTCDFLGNPVSETSADALAGINAFIEGFLAYETGVVTVMETAETHPDCLMANVYTGFIWMFMESAEGPQKAQVFLERARAAQGADALDRERLHVRFLECWIADDISGALALSEEGVRAHPRDLALLKLHQYLAFNLGRAAEMLRITEISAEAADDVAWLHGMRAFAFEQCHLLDEAEAAARRAIALRPKEPWAQHALAHVMLTEGRIDEGAAFLEAASPGWTNLNSFMLSHLWWHLALFYIAQGREAEALRLHDERVWGIDPGYTQDQISSVSLLARLEFAGVDVGERWIHLAEWLAPRAADTAQPFLSLQYLWGLIRADRPEALRLAAAIEAKAEAAQGAASLAWSQSAAPAARAMLALARGDAAAAARGLGRVLPRLAEIGGSHAQRDLFEQMRLMAVIRAGDLESAQQLLETRRRATPDDAPLNESLARIYAELGLPAQAAVAAARAQATRSRFSGI